MQYASSLLSSDTQKCETLVPIVLPSEQLSM
jgi:hypothetical protein